MSDDSSDKPAAVKPATKLWGIAGAVGFGALAYIIPQLVIAGTWPFLTRILPFSDNIQNFVYMGLLEALTILALIMIIGAYGQTLRNIGLTRLKWKFISWALGGLVIYVASTILISWIASLFTPIDFNQAQDVGFTSPNSVELVCVFLGLVVLPPLAEELLFRGFIFKGIRAKLHFVPTAIIVSLLFALAHGQWNVGLDVFVLSLVLCYMREKTNSLWPGILLHALKNLLAFLYLFVYTGPK